MPAYSLTSSWSDPIPVQAGDVVQNQSGDFVEICAVTPASSADAVKVPSFKGVTISTATSIRARSSGNWRAEIVVARGL